VLDKDAYSGKYSGVNKLINRIEDGIEDEETDNLVLEKIREFLNLFDVAYDGKLITNREIVSD